MIHKSLPIVLAFAALISTGWSAEYSLGCSNTASNDSDCHCEDSCPSNLGANPVNVIRGGLLRTVADLKVFGPAPFEFKRIYNSRTRDYTQRSWEMGTTYTWQHNWQYEVRESDQSSFGYPALIIRYPEGREKYFFATDSSGSVRVSDADYGDRLYPTGKPGEYVLRTPQGREYLFLKTGAGSTYQYLLTEVRAGQGWKWTLTYQTQSDGKQRLYRITNNYGRYIQLARSQVGSSNFWRINSVQSNDGRIVRYTYGTWSATAEHVLTRVAYPDSTTAEYTWAGANSLTTGAPLLATASDPNYGGAGARCRYIYNYSATYGGSNIVNGTVLEERNLDSNEVTVKLPLGGGSYPQVLDGGSTEITRKFVGNQTVESTDAMGRTTLFSYQTVAGVPNSGFLLNTTDSAGAVTTFTRDAVGRKLTQTNAIGGVRTFTYNSAGFELTERDELNRLTTNTRNVSNQITRTDYPDGTYETFTYTGTGLLKTHRFRNASTETFNYDGFGNLTSHVDAAGFTTTHTYHANGLRAFTITPLNQTTSFQYDWLGRTTRVTHPDNTFRASAYDSFGNVIMEADELLNLSTMTYDHFNRLTTVTDPLGRVTTYGYGGFNGSCGSCGSGGGTGLSSITYPDGTVTTYTYDPSWKKLTETLNSGTSYAATTSFTYDNVGSVATSTDALGGITTFTYDLLKRRTAVQDPLNRTTRSTYDAVGNLLTRTAPDNTVTTHTYDVMDRTLTVKDPLNHITSYSYNVPARTTTVTDPLGRAMITLTDALSRTISQTDPSGAVSLTAYDAGGRMTATTDPTGAVTTYTYNSRNHLIATTNPLGRITTRENDALGRTTATITPAPLSLRTEFIYDAVGNLLSTKRPDGRFITKEYDVRDRPTKLTEPQSPQNLVTLYSYHPTGALDTLTDPKGQVTTWNYDRLLRLTGKIYPNGDAHLYTYDAAGQLLTHKTPNNHIATHTYNPKGQLLTQTWNTTTPATIRTYFVDGQLQSITHGSSVIQYTYDAAHQILTDTQNLATLPALTIQATHDLNGRRRNSTYSAGRTVKYAWTTRGQLASVEVDGPPPFANYTYDAAGQLTSLAHENGVSENLAYDTNGRLLSRTHLFGSTPLGGHTYTLDALGRRTAETGGTGVSPVNRTFGYDPLGQVTAASYGTGLSDTYAYDKAGNRNSSSIASLGGASTLYTANNANQYTAITGVSQPISYDANGNLNLRNGNSYTWDSHNRLLSVIPQNPVAGSKAQHYTYDGFHRRVQRTIRVWQPSNQWTDLDSTRFFYDGWNVIEEHTITAGTQTLARTFTWGSDLSGTPQGAGGVGGLLLAEEVSGGNTTARHYHYDGNGNVTEITDLAGAKVASYRYDAYGNTLAASGPYSAQNRYRFSTKPLDGEVTGAPLYYYGYRYYDPITGSWPSRDPIEEEGGVNLYGFVGNNGVNWIDLLGLEDCCGNPRRPGKEVTDDAGRKCCEGEIKTIEIRVKARKAYTDSGHAYIHTPNHDRGFYAGDSIWWGTGRVFTEADNVEYNPENSYSYRACPDSVKKLDNEITENDKTNYNFTNTAGRNCAGWACQKIKNAGFIPPYNPSLPTLRPSPWGIR